jgi:hypothetical protein
MYLCVPFVVCLICSLLLFPSVLSILSSTPFTVDGQNFGKASFGQPQVTYGASAPIQYTVTCTITVDHTKATCQTVAGRNNGFEFAVDCCCNCFGVLISECYKPFQMFTIFKLELLLCSHDIRSRSQPGLHNRGRWSSQFS